MVRRRSHDQVRSALADASVAVRRKLPLAALVADTTTAKGQGRIEQRRCRANGDTIVIEAGYDLSGLPSDAAVLNTVDRHGTWDYHPPGPSVTAM